MRFWLLGVAFLAAVGNVPGRCWAYVDVAVEEELSSSREAPNLDVPVCSICLDSLPPVSPEGHQQNRGDGGSGATSRVTSCEHRFHVGCLDRWLQHHDSCPMCRTRIRGPRSLPEWISATQQSMQETCAAIQHQELTIFGSGVLQSPPQRIREFWTLFRLHRRAISMSLGFLELPIFGSTSVDHARMLAQMQVQEVRTLRLLLDRMARTLPILTALLDQLQYGILRTMSVAARVDQRGVDRILVHSFLRWYQRRMAMVRREHGCLEALKRQIFRTVQPYADLM